MSEPLTDGYLELVRGIGYARPTRASGGYWLPETETEIDLARQAEALEAARISLLAEVDRLRARVAELETVTANGRKLVSGWLKSSADHHSVSHLDALKTDPLMAGMQNGRANQYSDCANELQDVLDGEDPDGWEWGVTVTSSPESEPGATR